MVPFTYVQRLKPYHQSATGAPLEIEAAESSRNRGLLFGLP